MLYGAFKDVKGPGLYRGSKSTVLAKFFCSLTSVVMAN